MEQLIPIIAILSIIALPIATGLVIGLTSVKNQHKERMGLIQQGIIPPNNPKKKATPNRLVSLRNGIILICFGVGILVGFIVSNLYNEFKISSFFTVGASIAIFLGVGYLIYFFVTRNMKMPTENEADLLQE